MSKIIGYNYFEYVMHEYLLFYTYFEEIYARGLPLLIAPVHTAGC